MTDKDSEYVYLKGIFVEESDADDLLRPYGYKFVVGQIVEGFFTPSKEYIEGL